ncbi:uncharacterized protein J4E88_001878 [Alternaria novae-zelandiae]|uniref:uncharacterized protein n=1 Tax=Alternaria novae-zelandiae TaxID=430562 RepID=UPI0020C38C8B|nr:uncharacterized protein J4E88_001878 [Alternaria novae-zelandiae]KAI4693505.1 hypothetical protein J4E88_001878 [Alternaria novae-zelandiae]
MLATSNSPLLPPGITIPPSPVTTLVPTGTEVQSSASDLSIAILGVFPILQNWIKDPVAHVTEVTDELDNIIPDAVGFLAKLPKPTDGVEPCGSGKRRRSERNHELHDVLSERDLLGGLFKTAFSLVNCVINTTNKVKDAVIGGTTAAVDTVKGLQDDLKPLLDALNEVVPDEASEPSDSVSETEEPTQTSSSTCTLTTIRDSLNPYGSLEQGRGTTGLSFPLEDAADDWHLVNLWGCTSVVVISRKRMFLTHIWEKPSMEQPQLFQSDVLDVLRNGSPEFSHPLTVFTVPGEGFENIAENKVRAFIITPYRDFAINPASDDINYPYEVDKIKNLLNNILGRNDALIIPYTPAEENNRDETTPKGKIYIQYDPVAAALVPAEGGCNQQQVAGIELWFEDAPTYRYRDTWQPFPDQVVQAEKRSVASSGKDLRLLRGREVTDADEAEWKEFEALMKRQDGDTCARPSNSLSVSSASPIPSPASTVPTPSTFQTTVRPSLSDSTGGSSSPSPPPSSIATSPSSQSSMTSATPSLTWTPAQPSTTKTPSAVPKPSPASQPPPPPQTEPPTKALSVIFRNTNGNGEDYNNWTFFEIKPNTQADGCSVPILNDVSRQWSDASALSNPPWPHGTFTMPLFGEEDCEYQSDGTNPGVLHCPSMGLGKTVGCKKADEKDNPDDITDCQYPGLERKVHIVVYCEW